MNVLSLCAGVGGLDLGVELATGGVSRTVCFVEREAHAAAVLVARMEEALLAPAAVWSDLTTFDGREWRGVVDLVVAGYPCQPFSTAGKRSGTDDPRHLWPHVARIIRECGAGLVFLENVPGHLSLGFDAVCDDLQGMDYRVAAGLFSAAEVGAPHERKRLFALAYSDIKGFQGYERRVYEKRHINPYEMGSPPFPKRKDDLPTPQSHGGFDGPPGWVDRLRACGNGVVPLAAAHAFRTLTAALAGCVEECQ